MFIYLIEQIWSRYDVTFDLLIQQMFKGKTKNFDIAWLEHELFFVYFCCAEKVNF